MDEFIVLFRVPTPVKYQDKVEIRTEESNTPTMIVSNGTSAMILCSYCHAAVIEHELFEHVQRDIKIQEVLDRLDRFY
jgi:uncharacterized protein YodC (DUF2158 family)